jgi:hypothetical protein
MAATQGGRLAREAVADFTGRRSGETLPPGRLRVQAALKEGISPQSPVRPFGFVAT